MPFRRTGRVLDFQQYQKELEPTPASSEPSAEHAVQAVEPVETSEKIISKLQFSHDNIEQSSAFASSLSWLLDQLKSLGRDHHFKAGDNEFVLQDKTVLVSSSHEIAVRRSKKSADKHSVYVKAEPIAQGSFANVSGMMGYYLTGNAIVEQAKEDFVWKQYAEPQDESAMFNEETREAGKAEYTGANVAGVKTKRIFPGKDGLILFQAKQGSETLADYIERELYANKAGYSKRIGYQLSLKCLALIGRFHEKDRIHGDIKPNNFSYDPISKEVKLIDFGESCKVGDEKQYKRIDEYSPPEADPFFAKMSLKPAYMTQAGDIYAMAFCLANIWDCSVAKSMAGQRVTRVCSRVNDMSDEEKREITLIINKMFSAKPEERPTAAQVFHSIKALYQDCAQTKLLKK